MNKQLKRQLLDKALVDELVGLLNCKRIASVMNKMGITYRDVEGDITEEYIQEEVRSLAKQLLDINRVSESTGSFPTEYLSHKGIEVLYRDGNLSCKFVLTSCEVDEELVSLEDIFDEDM